MCVRILDEHFVPYCVNFEIVFMLQCLGLFFKNNDTSLYIYFNYIIITHGIYFSF